MSSTSWDEELGVNDIASSCAELEELATSSAFPRGTGTSHRTFIRTT